MKVLVFGIPGSGKTTFSNRLSKLTDTPVFHIDRHFFQNGKGWVERPREDFLNDVRKHLKEETWIIDGNGMRSLEMRFKEADIAIYCAFPRWICMLRIFYRWISTLGKEKLDGPEGSVNNVSLKLLKYLWNFPSRYSTAIKVLSERHPNVEFVHATNRSDLEEILNRFKKEGT